MRIVALPDLSIARRWQLLDPSAGVAVSTSCNKSRVDVHNTLGARNTSSDLLHYLGLYVGASWLF